MNNLKSILDCIDSGFILKHSERDVSVKDDIFNGYNQAGDRLMYLYA